MLKSRIVSKSYTNMHRISLGVGPTSSNRGDTLLELTLRVDTDIK